MKFRRQRPVGVYVADFFCSGYKLIVELDGESHNEFNSRADKERQIWLEANGYKVIRFENDVVIEDLDGVLEEILAICGLEN